MSARVYRRKLDYLRSIIAPADRVIILGDFWDGFLTDFAGFLDSGWNKLFPMLLERQAVYVYGNHDRREWSDERVSQFSVEQALEYRLAVGANEFLLTHGHAGIFAKTLDERYDVLSRTIPLRIGASIDVLHKLVWGRRFLESESDINDAAREWASENLVGNQLLICGHSHFPEIDYDNRMANSGFIGCGFGNYLLVKDGNIELVKERYWRKQIEV